MTGWFAQRKMSLIIRLAKSLGFPYVDVYAPNDEIIAITFANDERYVIQTMEIELT